MQAFEISENDEIAGAEYALLVLWWDDLKKQEEKRRAREFKEREARRKSAPEPKLSREDAEVLFRNMLGGRRPEIVVRKRRAAMAVPIARAA